MRKTEIKGIMHDLLDVYSVKDPLHLFATKEKYVFDMIVQKNNFVEEDSITEFIRKKRGWFLERVKSLNGNLEDFDKVEFSVFVKKEKVEVVYKGEKFEDEKIW